MSNIVNLIGDNDGFESEEALKRVYGDDAVFSKVGLFTLVHLDNPTQEKIDRRTNEFDPREFFVDECPLCEASRNHGGHIVFQEQQIFDDEDDVSAYNAEHEEADRDEVASYAATPLKAPAVELLRALDQLDVAADNLICEMEPWADAELLKRAIEDVGFLHDRFVESMWATETPESLDVFEQQLARALTTLEVVREENVTFEATVDDVETALEKIAKIWREL